jgi:hypothetical protein
MGTLQDGVRLARAAVDAKNMDKYLDRLDEGSKQLLKQFPAYRLDVFPTHRSACFPQWAYDNTVKNVMRPKLVGDAPGIQDARQQIPFPIPKTGYEVMWNFLLHFRAPYESGNYEIHFIDSSGNMMRIAPLRMDQKDPSAWIYVPGQRRVRLAPEFKYDTAAAAVSGTIVYDETNGGFDGKMDRFDFKLVGKREMYIPYNNYRFHQQPIEKVAGKNFIDPNAVRWELHRVWRHA